MLTGDKLETAENIARSCKLIQQDMTIMNFSDKTLEGTTKKMTENLEISQLCKNQNRKKTLLIEGETLGFILNIPFIFLKFMNFFSCHSNFKSFN